MRWNWEQPDWPQFHWDRARLQQAEERFLFRSGVFAGTVKHLGPDEQEQLTIEAMGLEALTTSEIEGELLDRASVQSSLRRQLGLVCDERRVRPSEQGIAAMMIDLYRTYSDALTEETMFGWHRMVTMGRADLRDIGCYRTASEAMQVVSGALVAPKVHFEAPPSARVLVEMAGFVAWFNRTAPGGPEPLPAVTRAGLAPLSFESIHPGEDGNGRLGRAIAEKALAQSAGLPTLTALAATILIHRHEYYRDLAAANRSNDVNAWLCWFGGIVLEAQNRTEAEVEFLLNKAKLLDGLRGRINPRQEKAVLRMLREGLSGFRGGLSAANHMTITGASPATATRDLADLVEKGALVRVGQLRHARYLLGIGVRRVEAVRIAENGELREEGASGASTGDTRREV